MVISKFSKILRLELSTELIIPIVLIALYVGFLLAFRGSIPTSEELISRLAGLYERFGYEVIFIGAALEALVVINLFVPGSVAVAFGAIFARSGQVDLTWAVLAASLGAIVGYTADFIFGYFGFGKMVKRLDYGGILTKARVQIEKNDTAAFILGFIHPNVGSFISFAAGTLRSSFTTFLILATLSTFAWVSFWAILIFALGDVFLIVLTKYIWVVVLLVLSIWVLSGLYGKRKE